MICTRSGRLVALVANSRPGLNHAFMTEGAEELVEKRLRFALLITSQRLREVFESG